MVLDESGFAMVPNLPRAWSPAGEPHTAEAGVTRHRLNVIGALERATGEVTYALSPTGFTRTEVAALIDGLASAAEAPLTLVVLDNARSQHGFESETVDRWLIDHRVVLCHLPPFSPELDPIESVWREAKYHWRRFVTGSRQELETEVRNLLDSQGSKYQNSFT